jgi:succinate dehydrogenase / fumarate reductase cytochrome b subunit
LKFTVREASIGKKILVAGSGFFLLAFVIVHLVGNLQAFAGPEAINGYAEKLRHLAPVLWAARLFLISMLVLHVWLAARLAWENRRARPVRYACEDTVQASFASRTMMMSGLLVFVFVVYHLLHFTFRVTHPVFAHLVDAHGRHDVYAMMVLSFQERSLSSFYVLATGLLALHMSHAGWSMFQTSGAIPARGFKLVQHMAGALALAVFLGYSSIPLAVVWGVIKLP